jgi:hypothetical protein
MQSQNEATLLLMLQITMVPIPFGQDWPLVRFWRWWYFLVMFKPVECTCYSYFNASKTVEIGMVYKRNGRDKHSANTKRMVALIFICCGVVMRTRVYWHFQVMKHLQVQPPLQPCIYLCIIAQTSTIPVHESAHLPVCQP